MVLVIIIELQQEKHGMYDQVTTSSEMIPSDMKFF